MEDVCGLRLPGAPGETIHKGVEDTDREGARFGGPRIEDRKVLHMRRHRYLREHARVRREAEQVGLMTAARAQVGLILLR